MRAGDETTRLDDVAKLAPKLELEGHGQLDAAAAARAVTRRLESRAGWLLIFDDAPDPASVEDLLPACGGHIIVTSRLRTGWDDLEAASLDVTPWSTEEACAYSRRAGAAGCVRRRRARPGRAPGRPAGVDQARGVVSDRVRHAADGVPDERRTALELSLDRLPAAGRQLLRLCAPLAPGAIPMELFANHLDWLPRQLTATASPRPRGCAPSTRCSTARRTSCSIKPAVQARAFELLRDRRGVMKTAIRLLDAEFGEALADLADPAQWPHCARIAPHVLAVAERARAIDYVDETLAMLLMHTGSYLERRGQERQARKAPRQALAVAERTYGRRSSGRARLLNALGFALCAQGAAGEALSHHRRALAIFKSTPGSEPTS